MSRNRRNRRNRGEPNGLALLDQGLQLLKRAPAGAHALYLSGTLPFALGLSLYWTEMTTSPFANRLLVPGALGLAVLYALMKVSHALYARRLTAILQERSYEPLSAGQLFNLTCRQTFQQSLGLLTLPFVLVIGFPLPYWLAYFQSLSAAEAYAGSPVQSAMANVKAWSSSNFSLGLMTVPIVALVMWINWLLIFILVPYFADAMLGVQTDLATNPTAYFSTSLLGYLTILTYLTLDPLVKATYTCRLFALRSRTTGEDLRVRLRQLAPITPSGSAVAVVALALVACLVPAETHAQAEPTPAEVESVWNEALDDTLQQRKYLWRYPPEAFPDGFSENSWLGDIFYSLEDSLNAFRDWWRSVIEWLEDLFQRDDPPEQAQEFNRSEGSGDWLRYLIIALIAITLAILVVVLIRAYRQRQRVETTELEALDAQPEVLDLEDEDLRPEAAASDRWREMGREQLASGNYRLALRAFFLAQLSRLGERNLLRLAKHKTNRDYRMELERRQKRYPKLAVHFREDARAFEAVWYGNAMADHAACQALDRRLDVLPDPTVLPELNTLQPTAPLPA